jgi:hypothetical protein
MERGTNQMKPARRLLKRATAAEVLDTSITTLKALEKAGKLTPIRLGLRHVHYDVKEVEALASGAQRGRR